MRFRWGLISLERAWLTSVWIGLERARADGQDHWRQPTAADLQRDCNTLCGITATP